jgi:choline dehydrogenase-like flavoprotein
VFGAVGGAEVEVPDRDDRHQDVIIVGTGAGGGTLAHRPARTGKRVAGRRRRFPPGPGREEQRRRVHDVENLYVVDTSFFPSIGAVNPSLTAMANALRVGDHLAERLR